MYSIRVVGKTMPKIEGINTVEEFIVYAARVSNPSNQMNNETAPKLMKYLMKNKHWSPFEMSHIVIEIQTTRDIGRQILRHRSFSFQEFSQRYAVVNVEDMVFSEARLQDEKNRQNSIKVDDDVLQNWWLDAQKEVSDLAIEKYNMALEKGIAKEQARKLLPEGLTPTTMYMSGTVRSWLHYIQERTKDGVQLEHRLLALAIAEELSEELPSIAELISNEE